ncbi:MAG: helix-turn-helix transcriptional regulator [Pyrinomonadaceae bacterium]|nr:helix-turn-helix transcriptional regulator [Pyrinomonadaceae bacterium]
MVLKSSNARSGIGRTLEILMKNVDLTDDALELIAERFRMLSEPMRLRILNTLGENEMSVTEIVAATGANQANVSKHLSILFRSGIVSRRKQGLTANYRVSDPTIFELCDLVCDRLKDHHETRQNTMAKTLPSK